MLLWLILLSFGGLGGLGWAAYRLLWPGCDLFLYVRINGVRVPVRVGRLRKDHRLLDLARNLAERVVGEVYVGNDGQGVVRLYHLELGDGHEEEAGSVTTEGQVSTSGARSVGSVEPDGKRRWYELWLRLHSQVYESPDAPPVGKCIETGRWRRRKPSEVTLLARAGAGLLLYDYRRGPGEVPAATPSAIWDTALPAAVLFAAACLSPRAPELIASLPLVIFGFPMPYLAKGILAFVLLWLSFHLIKQYLYSQSDAIVTDLLLVNRQTGISTWGYFGVAAVAVFFYVADAHAGVHGPVLVAAGIGFFASTRATAAPWPVKPRVNLGPAPVVTPPEGSETRTYRWRLDSMLRALEFETSARFDPAAVSAARAANPFFTDWQEAARNARAISRELVRAGSRSEHVTLMVAFVHEQVRTHGLSTFETIQLVLDFVQEPNITYWLDDQSPELNDAKEYFRSAVETLFDKRGDCDCKAVLAATLLKAMGFPVLLVISDDACHAAIAVGGAPEPWSPDLAFIVRNGIYYYYCETTGEHWQVGQSTTSAAAMLRDPNALIEV